MTASERHPAETKAWNSPSKILAERFGYITNVIWVPVLEDHPPPPQPPADLTGLAAYAVPWPRAAVDPRGQASIPPASGRWNPPEPRDPGYGAAIYGMHPWHWYLSEVRPCRAPGPSRARR